MELTPLYISKAFPETLRERIKEPHDALHGINKFLNEKPERNLLVMLGIFTNISNQKVSEDLFNAVKHCLINTNRPLSNPSYIENYTGSLLEINNEGNFHPLKAKSICRI